jgi:hypothetical protein
MKRLDLDAARSKQKKNKMFNSQSNTPAAMVDVSIFRRYPRRMIHSHFFLLSHKWKSLVT